MAEMDKLWDLVESYREKENAYKEFVSSIEELSEETDLTKKEMREYLKEYLEHLQGELNGID